MDTVEEKAVQQAEKHFKKFMDDCEWPDMLEKYAEITNRYAKVRNELLERDERGSRLDSADFADYHYYERYYLLMAKVIANNTLVAEGYERDKKGNWILKKQPVSPPTKKRFGFWG